jgi:hypothetical protein
LYFKLSSKKIWIKYKVYQHIEKILPNRWILRS